MVSSTVKDDLPLPLRYFERYILHKMGSARLLFDRQRVNQAVNDSDI